MMLMSEVACACHHCPKTCIWPSNGERVIADATPSHMPGLLRGYRVMSTPVLGHVVRLTVSKDGGDGADSHGPRLIIPNV